MSESPPTAPSKPQPAGDGAIPGETDAIRKARTEAYAEGYEDGRAFTAEHGPREPAIAQARSEGARQESDPAEDERSAEPPEGYEAARRAMRLMFRTDEIERLEAELSRLRAQLAEALSSGVELETYNLAVAERDATLTAKAEAEWAVKSYRETADREIKARVVEAAAAQENAGIYHRHLVAAEMERDKLHAILSRERTERATDRAQLATAEQRATRAEQRADSALDAAAALAGLGTKACPLYPTGRACTHERATECVAAAIRALLPAHAPSPEPDNG